MHDAIAPAAASHQSAGRARSASVHRECYQAQRLAGGEFSREDSQRTDESVLCFLELTWPGRVLSGEMVPNIDKGADFSLSFGSTSQRTRVSTDKKHQLSCL